MYFAICNATCLTVGRLKGSLWLKRQKLLEKRKSLNIKSVIGIDAAFVEDQEVTSGVLVFVDFVLESLLIGEKYLE
ncbi:MAG: hypothetical protein US72_C0011G0046 [Microgenomates group bacterium GW2011_GWC1_38_12]|nr:MAG: hypothetical protein US72_C0011G0046 [Microgenomates group bacterium GW2011_GWC1_38_12]